MVVFLRYLKDFKTIPAILRNEVVTQFFEKAALANFNQSTLNSYENSLKTYRDLKGVIDTAFDEGKLKGVLKWQNL